MTTFKGSLLTEAAERFMKFAGYSTSCLPRGLLRWIPDYASHPSQVRSCAWLKLQSLLPLEHIISGLCGPTERGAEDRGGLVNPDHVARTKLREGSNGFKFADCAALSFREIRSMLDCVLPIRSGWLRLLSGRLLRERRVAIAGNR